MIRFDIGIITNAKRPAKLREMLDSVWSQSIEVEALNVLICGDILRARCAVRIDYVFAIGAQSAANAGRLGSMRNKIVEHVRPSSGENWPEYEDHYVVISDDDMIFSPDFCEQVMAFEGEWDVMCPRIENPDGTRYWDWATSGGPRGHMLLGYDQPPDFHWYNTGGMFVCKAEVFDKVLWPEDIPIDNHTATGGLNEDVIFSNSIKEMDFKVVVNQKAVVTHNDERLTSKRQHWVYEK